MVVGGALQARQRGKASINRVREDRPVCHHLVDLASRARGRVRPASIKSTDLALVGS